MRENITIRSNTQEALLDFLTEEMLSEYEVLEPIGITYYFLTSKIKHYEIKLISRLIPLRKHISFQEMESNLLKKSLSL